VKTILYIVVTFLVSAGSIAFAFTEDSQPGDMEYGKIHHPDGSTTRYEAEYWPYGSDANGGSETIIKNLDTGERTRIVTDPSLGDDYREYRVHE